MHKAKQIKTIVLYESSKEPAENTRPLNIDLSLDGTQWKTVTSITSVPNPNNPVSIVFEASEIARYIRIKATGICKLTLDEVEVYGPAEKEL
jgi:hypothetical protein